MEKIIILLSLCLFLTSCGSSSKDKEVEERELEEREHDDIEREYIVRDASSNIRPGWVEDAEIWAKQNGKDTKTYRYFSYETEPKVARRISCDLAKANARADIAGEIATFIDKSLAVSQNGDASIDENSGSLGVLRESLSNTLTEKVQGLIHGAAIVKTYWEKRNYLKDRGAKKDFKAYTCAVFIRANNSRLEEAIRKAANFAADEATDSKTKTQVEKALKDASINFAKAKRGEI